MKINIADSACIRGSMEFGKVVYIAQGTVVRGDGVPESLCLGNQTRAYSRV